MYRWKQNPYFEKHKWIDKCFRRENALEDICPSHFVKIYDSFSGKAPKIAEDNDSYEEEDEEQDNEETDTIRKYGKEAKFHHFITSEGKLGKPLPKFVLLENPYPGEPKFLKKRKHPKALRLFKVKRENNPARFFLQELMLYTCFDEKMYNDWHDDDKCMQANLEKEEEIRAVKNQVMEWLEDVEEGRYFVEETMKNQIETGEIGEVLDVENEKYIEECEEEGIEADPLYEHLDRGDHNENEFSPFSNWCKKIELVDEDLNMKKTQNLDKYQKKTLDIALKYARDLVKSHHYKNALPETPNLIVLGGAGAGKSTVIHSIIQWVQRILQTPGDDPQPPYILATATTGAASVIIQGMTIHSAVGFQHGNKHNSLSDKKREKKRDQFNNLKFLIIDEFSMLKSDMLY